jgi:uncharacterized protein affecting Mg2+/Co2+ transport
MPQSPPAPMSEAVTDSIRVEVMSQYSPENSRPLQDVWVFEYTVRITNQGTETVQLLTRHWIITDALDHVEEVKGPGVIGEQPVLAPGESFKYSSPQNSYRHDERHLSDDPPRRSPIRYRDRPLRAQSPLHGQLTFQAPRINETQTKVCATWYQSDSTGSTGFSL